MVLCVLTEYIFKLRLPKRNHCSPFPSQMVMYFLVPSLLLSCNISDCFESSSRFRAVALKCIRRAGRSVIGRRPSPPHRRGNPRKQRAELRFKIFWLFLRHFHSSPPRSPLSHLCRTATAKHPR